MCDQAETANVVLINWEKEWESCQQEVQEACSLLGNLITNPNWPLSSLSSITRSTQLSKYAQTSKESRRNTATTQKRSRLYFPYSRDTRTSNRGGSKNTTSSILDANIYGVQQTKTKEIENNNLQAFMFWTIQPYLQSLKYATYWKPKRNNNSDLNQTCQSLPGKALITVSSLSLSSSSLFPSSDVRRLPHGAEGEGRKKLESVNRRSSKRQKCHSLILEKQNQQQLLCLYKHVQLTLHQSTELLDMLDEDHVKNACRQLQYSNHRMFRSACKFLRRSQQLLHRLASQMETTDVHVGK